MDSSQARILIAAGNDGTCVNRPHWDAFKHVTTKMPDEPAKHSKRDYLVACGCRTHYTQNPDEVQIYLKFNTAQKDYKKDEAHWRRFQPNPDTPQHAQYEAWQARKEQFDRLEKGGPPYAEALGVVNNNEHNANLPFARYSPTVEGGTRAAARQQFVASVSSDDESSSESDSDEAAGTDVDDDPDEPYESSDEEVDDEVRHALDSINSIEDLGAIFPKLTKFAKVDEEHGRRARALVEDLVALFHDGSTMTSLSNHYEKNTAIRQGNTVIEKGHSMRQLWLRLQPKTVELYCCRDGHDFGEPNSRCGRNLPNGKMCKHDRIIKCTHFDLREMLHFLMRDPEFAKNVRWGLEKMDPLDDRVPQLVDTVMRSQGVKDLERRIQFRSTGPNSLPLLMEMMVDGFQATNASRTIDTVRQHGCLDALMFGHVTHITLTLELVSTSDHCRFSLVSPACHRTWSRITSCLSPSSTVRVLRRGRIKT